MVAAASQTQVALSSDHGTSFTQAAKLPVDTAIGIAYVNGVAVSATHAVAAGSAHYTGSAPGAAWALASFGGVDVQAVELLPTGASLVVGRFGLVGHVAPDGATSAVPVPAARSRFLHAVRAVASDVWIAGERGTILHSSDGGSSFASQPTPVDSDLYGVAFDGPTRGLAVGAHGAAIFTTDGGATWHDVSIGADVMLAGAAFDAAGKAVAVGEGGRVLRLVE